MPVLHVLGMQIGLRHFSAGTIEWLKGASGETGRTRHSLARELCERENWRNPRGVPCLAQASKALSRLSDKVGIWLPEARAMPCRTPGTVGGEVERGYPDLELRCGLSELGEVTLVPVGDAADKRSWREMMESHHPQGWSRRPGAVLNWWIVSSVHGRLGGIGFCAASWHQAARDAFIGWSAAARVANLTQLVNQHRFLLLPGVRVDNLASHVLALSTARLAGDWQAAHGAVPLAAYTYVGPERRGTCYRAAGWKCCAERTSGSPPGRRAAAPKSVWIKPLAEGWRDALCREPAPILGTTPEPCRVKGADWADFEYGRSSHPDGRLRKRLLAMGRAWENAPGASLPVIFPAEAEQKAAYRLLSNDRIKMDDILQPHREATVERCRLEPVVLAIQDTTTLNYNGHRKTTGLVDLGGGGSGTRGILAHVGLAISETRRPLGVFELNATQRDGADAAGEAEPESVRWLRRLESAGQLAMACPDTRVVTVCDREGDIWEMFCKARESGDGLLIRSDRGRQRRAVVDGKTPDLWDVVAAQPVLGTKTIERLPCGGPRRRRRRKARLDLRAAEEQGQPGAAAHARRLGPGTRPAEALQAAPLALAHHRGRGRHRQRPAHRCLVRGALDRRGILQDPQGRHPRRGSQARRRRRPAKVSRLRRRHRMARHGPRTPRPRQASHARARALHRARNQRPLSLAQIPSHHPRPARQASRHPHRRGRPRTRRRLPSQQATAPPRNRENLAGMAAIQSRNRLHQRMEQHPMNGTFSAVGD